MERITDDLRLDAIRQSGVGVVFNDFAGRGASASAYKVLHAASCRWLIRSNTSVRKLWFDDLAAAIDWLTRERGLEGIAWRRCVTCQGAGARGTAAVAQASPTHIPPVPGSTFAVSPDPDRRAVLAWSTTRLPFEPNAEMRAFRDELRKATSALTAERGEALHATYRSPLVAAVDVENVLLYNVGNAAFAASTHSELVIERSFAAVDDPPLALPRAAHRHEYRIEPAGSPLLAWKSVRDLARFGPVAVGSRGLAMRVSSVWLPIRRGQVSLPGVGDSTGPIGVDLVVEVPHERGLNLAALSKPLIDGVIAAFHPHVDDGRMDLVAQRIADQTDASMAEVISLLRDNPNGLLGSRQLVWPWRSGVQWNPADDRITAARIRCVTRVPTGSAPEIRLSGVIQELRPIEAAG